MTVKSQARDDRKAVLKDFRRSLAPCDTFEALDKSDIAELSDATINDMTCDELVRMIRVAKLPDLLGCDLDRHLPFYDHPVLTRLAHLARQCCRKQESGSLGKDAE
jgi:hypothetical protein